jgi:hypothetical protein
VKLLQGKRLTPKVFASEASMLNAQRPTSNVNVEVSVIKSGV